MYFKLSCLWFGCLGLLLGLASDAFQLRSRFLSTTRRHLLNTPFHSVFSSRLSSNKPKSQSSKTTHKKSSLNPWMTTIGDDLYSLDHNLPLFWPPTLPVWAQTVGPSITTLSGRPLIDDLSIMSLGRVRHKRPDRPSNRRPQRNKRRPMTHKKTKSTSNKAAWIDYSSLLPAVSMPFYDPSYVSYMSPSNGTSNKS
jgi:hypothetical protein